MSYKIKFICLKFSTLLVLLLIFQTAIAQKKVKEIGLNVFPEFDEILNQDQKVLGNNAVAMIWTDTLVYKKELGDFTSTTQTPIASCSKWLTTALVMQFIDEGKLSLDDKVSKYIPLFATYNKNYITIRHCLSHMTGIQSEVSKLVKFVAQPKKYNSLEDEVNDFAKKEIQSNPGTEFSYSDIGIDIAARIVEIVSKKKFDLLIRAKLLVPLQMRQTSFTTLDGSAINPSNGAVSTASDYIHFLQMLLNNGKYNGQQVLSEEAVKQMRQVQTSPEIMKYVPKVAQGYSYALGSWVIEEDNNKIAAVLTCPSLSGSWSVIDFCKGYACLIFVKPLLSEQKADIYNQMKAAIDEKLQSKCK